MDCRISELQYKEVVDITDGTRYGFIDDVELDCTGGSIRSIIIAGKARWFGLLGRDADTVFPWSAIKRIGSDIILVDGGAKPAPHTAKRTEFAKFFLKKQ